MGIAERHASLRAKRACSWIGPLLIALVSGCGGTTELALPDPSSGGGAPSLSPADWDEGELEAYSQMNDEYPDSHPAVTAEHGMISGTSSALAVRSGFEALKQGGTAADAALATALAQVALIAGAYVSYAGILFVTYYDAAQGQTFYLNAGFNTPLYEADPLSIPDTGPSGRTAMVPGFFAGLHAAHERFGSLPWATLYEPALYFAEEGFEINGLLGSYIQWRQDVLSRLPTTQAIFTKEGGGLYEEGDWFTQPALAATLHRVADEGSAYIYEGEWASRFVQAVQADGGTITEEDLSRYDVIWSDPLRTTFEGFDVAAPGLPSLGGVNSVEALNVLEAAGYPGGGSYAQDAEALFWFAQIHRLMALGFLSPEALALVAGDLDLSPASRATKPTAAALWAKMASGELYFTTTPEPGAGTHSDSVVAVDQWGNVCALTHTINTTVWGETGIFVDGISVPDAASHQQQRVLDAGPGQRLPEETNPLIVFREGVPVLASSSIGVTHYRTLAVLYQLLTFEPAIEPAFRSPFLLFPDWGDFAGASIVERITEGHFDAALVQDVQSLGLNLVELPEDEALRHRGYWVGIQIDLDAGLLTGVTSDYLNGAVLGH